jgi:hypothetical protein
LRRLLGTKSKLLRAEQTRSTTPQKHKKTVKDYRSGALRRSM